MINVDELFVCLRDRSQPPIMVLLNCLSIQFLLMLSFIHSFLFLCRISFLHSFIENHVILLFRIFFFFFLQQLHIYIILYISLISAFILFVMFACLLGSTVLYSIVILFIYLAAQIWPSFLKVDIEFTS